MGFEVRCGAVVDAASGCQILFPYDRQAEVMELALRCHGRVERVPGGYIVTECPRTADGPIPGSGWGPGQRGEGRPQSLPAVRRRKFLPSTTGSESVEKARARAKTKRDSDRAIAEALGPLTYCGPCGYAHHANKRPCLATDEMQSRLRRVQNLHLTTGSGEGEMRVDSGNRTFVSPMSRSQYRAQLRGRQ